MNEMGGDGWEYLRADTLPCEERQGLTGKTVKYHSMLVFRRPVAEVLAEAENAAQALALPMPEEDVSEEEVVEIAEETSETTEVAELPEAANDDSEKRGTVAAE